jgi:hypothetical protein
MAYFSGDTRGNDRAILESILNRAVRGYDPNISFQRIPQCYLWAIGA